MKIPPKHQINLLPWRLNLYQKKLRQLILYGVILLTIVILSAWKIQNTNQLFQAEIKQLQQQTDQLSKQEFELTQTIRQQQQQLSGKLKLNYLPPEILEKLFPFLTELPLQEGNLYQVELNSIPLAKQNMPLFQLSGITANQNEFSQLQQKIEQFWQVYSPKQQRAILTPLKDKLYQFSLEFSLNSIPN